jgi:filamentous hemagglutinin
MGHQELDEFVADAQVCEARGNCDEVRQKFRDISLGGDDALGALCATDPASCIELYGDLAHDRLSLQERISKLYFDDSIPSVLKRDLHVYQMQNMSAVGTLTKAQVQIGLENQGLSSDSAQLGAMVAAAAASGGLVGRTGGANGASSAATPNGAIWSSTKSKSAVENALGHWNKHKSEFPELQNAKQYAEQSKRFLTNPPQGTLTKTNARGDTLRYDPNTNTFGVLGQDGAPRTMFRPADGINYWNRQ